MQLSVLTWSLLGCATFIIGPSLAVKRIPSSQDIEELGRDIEKVFSQRKELGNGPIAKDKSVNAYDVSYENQLHNGDRELRTNTLNTGAKKFISGYGLTINGASRTSKNCLSKKCRKRQLQQCSNASSITCDATSKYRTFDGSCNNLRRPHLGQAGSCHRRILKAVYDDGVSEPKTYDSALPNPRDVCIALHRDSPPCDDCYDMELNALVMSFGQFIDHDITLTPTSSLPNNTPIRCCPESSTNHEDCFPIRLSSDPDFSANCMNFTRSSECEQCSVVERQQSNNLTPFLDCSHIYGITIDQANMLRSPNGDGKLNTTFIPGIGELLPPNPNAGQLCGSSTCFLAGDTRVNQNPPLTMLHTVFALWHNVVAGLLKECNPTWDNDKLYQEARRCVIAVFQKIVYRQYLPLLCGDSTMSSFRLNEDETQYDSEQDPRTINEAMTAAFRLHSSVMDSNLCLTEDGKSEMIPLGKNFFNATPFYSGKLRCIAMGSFRQPQMALDPLLVSSVTRFLYVRSNATPPTLDLCSINIQRGRDHGLHGYTAFVEFCLGIRIRSFDDLRRYDLIYPECIWKYRELYEFVEDIDLWSGLQCEVRYRDSYAFLGRVSQCILGWQFHGTMYGDRYFWTHKGQLTPAEKAIVSNITIEVVMREALKLKWCPTHAFHYRSPVRRCDDYTLFPKLDLCSWGK